MRIKEINRDICSMPDEYIIAHNIDGGEVALGAGVAKAICDKYPTLRNAVKENIEAMLQEGWKIVGNVFPVECDGRTIFNMVTKPHVYFHVGCGITEEEYLENEKSCLLCIKQLMVDANFTKLALPKIGAGLDKCPWDKTYKLITSIFEDTNIDICICVI